MGFSFGLHVQQDYDLPAMMASPDMQQIYGTVLEVGGQLAGHDPSLQQSQKLLVDTVRIHTDIAVGTLHSQHTCRCRILVVMHVCYRNTLRQQHSLQVAHVDNKQACTNCRVKERGKRRAQARGVDVKEQI
jgi:hypothetical protein